MTARTATDDLPHRQPLPERSLIFSRPERVQFGLWVFLATVVMLFAAFASALVVRRAGTDWRRVALPPVVWANTAVLLAASGSVEGARRAARRSSWATARRRLRATAALGLTFLAGQGLAWRDLIARGLTLASNPHAAFFYVLSGLHAAHLVAALALATYGAFAAGAVRDDGDLAPMWPTLAATFWHVLTGLWVWVLLLLV